MTTPHQQLVHELTNRWPEHRVAPSLSRISALMDLLGHPERAMPVIQVAGTNGKGSTAIMIEHLLRAAGLRVGRFSSPHLSDATERISIDGQAISHERFAQVWQEIAPLVDLVDQQRLDGVPMTFFEVITGMAYAAFADAPVEVAVVEVGLGGRWDATSVTSPRVAVIAPIDLDHTHILGETPSAIAAEKAGIIKAGSVAVLAGQSPDVAKVLLAAAVEVGAQVLAEGPDFGLLGRVRAVDGQVLRLATASGPVGDLFLPLHGEHMARNAALAVAAAEAFIGEMTPEVIADGLASVTAPARLELVRRSPAIVLDTAHNPQAITATLRGVVEAFSFTPLIGVVGMMKDKNPTEVLRLLAEQLDQVVITQAHTPRALDVTELAEIAEQFWDPGRIHRSPEVPEAIDLAVSLADAAGVHSGILVVGSLIVAGEARDLLVSDDGEPRE